MPDRVVLHVDLNNFYASVACLTNPQWRETPLAVCGDPTLRHGIVLAKNMAAKRAGVKTGHAIWQARETCPRLQVTTPDFASYLRYSRAVRAVCERYTPRIQPFGIDESWLDLTAPDMTLARGEAIANHLRHAIREETGLTVSIGVSDNRIFAKLGSDLKKPDAVTLLCQQNRATALDPLSIDELLFVGPATARKLRRIAIYTIGQLAQTDVSVLRAFLGKNGEMLSHFARGEDESNVLPACETPPPKSVGNSITAARDLVSMEDARITLYGLCECVAARLRAHRLTGRTLSVSLRSADLDVCQRQTPLPGQTDLCTDLFACAEPLVRDAFAHGGTLRSMGVAVNNLRPLEEFTQLSFLPEVQARQRERALECALDDIRARYGHFSIQRGCMMADMRLGHINPREEHVIHPAPFFK